MYLCVVLRCWCRRDPWMATSLMQAPGGIADLTDWSSLSFPVSGPVVLNGYVNNVLLALATNPARVLGP